MALHAVDNIGDAFTAARSFLFPFELRRWLKLALVAFFLSGGMSVPTVQFDAPSTVDPSVSPDIPTVPVDVMTIVVTVVAVAVLFGVLYGLVGAIMEFVFVESLRTGEVTLRRYWGRRWRQGLRLFGFRIAISIPFLVLVVGWMAALVLPFLFSEVDPVATFGALFFVGLPLVFLVGLLYALVASFTTVFVVPIMIKTDSGVLAGWRRLWNSITSQPKQYLVYAVIAFGLTIAIGILASIVVGIVALLFLIPLVIVGVVLYFTVSLASTAVVVALAGLGLVVLLAIFVCWLLVQVPVLAYLRYYALLVLGDVDESLDLISEQRSAIRT